MELLGIIVVEIWRAIQIIGIVYAIWGAPKK